MAFICDIVIAAIIVLSVVLGCKRGLVKTAFKCLSLVVAIMIAYFFGSYAGDFFKTTDVYDSLCKRAENTITEYFEDAAAEGLADAKEAKDEFSSSNLGKTLSRLGLETDSFYENYEAAIDKGTENAKQKFAVEAAGKVMECLANALGVLATFVASLIVLKILSAVCNSIFKLPVLKTVNKLGGFVLGAVLGIFSAFVLCMVVEILLPYIPNNPVVYAGMDKDTVLYSFFVNLNPVIFLLFG